jgi:hypothetical protein
LGKRAHRWNGRHVGIVWRESERSASWCSHQSQPNSRWHRKKRDDFRDTIKKQAQANEAAWIREKARIESEWNAFEIDVKKYVETFGKQIEQQQATFKRQAAAQVKAWREAADNLRTAGKELAAKHRSEIDATVKRMEVDAATAEEKLQKLNQAGMQSWSALMGALGETRAAFDRANKAAQEAFKLAAPWAPAPHRAHHSSN